MTLWTSLPAGQRAWIAILGSAVLVAQIEAPFPGTAYLHHVPTTMVVAVAPWLLRRWPLSTGSVARIAVFLLLHTLGGRYTYSNVPYDEWAAALTGGTISEAMGWTRNHYDRLVHLAFGLCIAGPAAEVLERRLAMTPARAAWFALEFILAASCAYELFEWALTLIAAGPIANEYNGQQGDPWDAQNDMALAAAGAALALGWQALAESALRRGLNPEAERTRE